MKPNFPRTARRETAVERAAARFSQAFQFHWPVSVKADQKKGLGKSSFAPLERNRVNY
jgi:hypothetical protein